MANGRDKIPDTKSAMNLDKIYNGTVEEMFDSLNENFETIGRPQAIDTVSIKNGAITEDKINDGEITWDKLNTLLQDYLLNLAHPVHSLYWCLDETMTEAQANTPSYEKHPHTLFGGTWERIKDRFILAAGDKYGVQSYPEITGYVFPRGLAPIVIGGQALFREVRSFALDSSANRYQSAWNISFDSDHRSYNSISVSVFYADHITTQGDVIPRGSVIIEGASGGQWYRLNSTNITQDVCIYFTDGTVARFTPEMLDKNIPNLSDLAGIGGEFVHIISDGELASHSHLSPTYANLESGVYEVSTGQVAQYDYVGAAPTSTVGENYPHNNMPPYITAYCWRRTA